MFKTVRFVVPAVGGPAFTVASFVSSVGAEREIEIVHIMRVLMMTKIFCDRAICRSDMNETRHCCLCMSPSNRSRCNVAIAFVVRLSDTRPDPVHQLFMVLLAVMEAAIGFSEGVSFLARSDEVTFRRKP